MNQSPAEYQAASVSAIPEPVEGVAKKVLDAAFKVYTALGPSPLESVYETHLGYGLKGLDVAFQSQIELPIVNNEFIVESGLRLDLFVEKCVIVEVKAVEVLNPVFKAQLLTCLKLTNTRLGLLINFNATHLRDDIARLIN